jgi:hypothetical protein
MAHFAKIDSNNKVIQVIKIDNAQEDRAIDFITKELGLEGTWIQTSYNTRAGKHMKDGTPLRMNYALVGSTYDAEKDVFIPPKLFASWILNEENYNWNPPVAYPKDGKRYRWDESIVNWTEVIMPPMPTPPAS